VKFHWKPKQGLQSVVWNEAVKINGADPDFHRRDLWDSIEAGDFPEWELGVQLFDEAFAEKFEFDVLDATKLIPEEQVPVKIIGRMVLDRRVDNFFAETEQVAFCTQNIVPGIDFSNDPLLQGRNFSYLDTQLKRLGGPNFTHIPINAPKCPFSHFQQDGHMAMHNPKGRVNYEPNSWADGGPRESPELGFKSCPEPVEGPKVRARSETFSDHYSQARQFYISQTEIEQRHIGNALTFELSKVQTPGIRARMVSHLLNIDAGLAEAVAKGLRLKEMPKPATAAKPTRQDLKPSPKLSIIKNGPKNFAGRKVGALVTDGVDAAVLAALGKALKTEGAMLKLIAPEVGGIKDSAGAWHDADEKLEGGPSVLFDAVAILPSKEGATLLTTLPAARDFIADATAHRKFIAYGADAAPLMEKAGVALDEGFVQLKKAGDCDGFVATCRKLRFWDRAAAER
jgi:catalase